MMFTTFLTAALLPLGALAHSAGGNSHHKRSGAHRNVPRATLTMDDADTTQVSFTGNWTHGTIPGGDTLSWSNAAEASFNFTTPKGAKGITITSTLKEDRGTFQVLMDGKVVGNGTTRSAGGNGNSTAASKSETQTKSQVVFKANITDKAKHTWKVVKTSPKGVYLSLDAVNVDGVKTATSGSPLQGYFTGGNNYFLYSMEKKDREGLLDAMKDAGMQVARMFITHVGQGSKGSASIDVPDVEQNGVGKYDDTILEAIDQLMVEASQRGIRLILSMHDRYALGFWGTDQYAYKYGIVSQGSEGAQEVGDASAFYTSKTAAQQMDARMTHIMNHRNKLMGNKRWADLPEAIYAVEPQNEPMGHMDLVAPNWVCDRAATLKKLIGGSGIIVSSGGGITTDTSLQSWATDCANIDVIAVHDYGTDASSTVGTLSSAKAKYGPKGKVVMFEEFGATGGGKSGQISSFVQALKKAGIPWSYWEITNPGQGSNDFEVWTDETDSWAALKAGAAKATGGKRSTTIVPAVGKSSRRSVRRSEASRRNANPPARVP